VAEEASERVRIEASAARCYTAALDFASYPRWAKDVKSVTVLETDDQGRGTRVEFRAAALGKSIRYVLGYDYTEAPHGFSWHFVEGEMLRRLDGTYRFESEGESTTRVHYDLAVEVAVPIPGMVKRRAASLIIGSALKELKRYVESLA
jgi:uncharacterized membrane protein